MLPYNTGAVRDLMDIRTKTLLSLGVIFTLFLGLILGISVSLYLDELQALDNSDINADVQRGLNALANEQEDLAATLHDWAYWDDTYRFAQDQNPEYILQNLNANSLDSLSINVLLVTDPSGIPVYSTMIDPATRQVIPLPEDISAALPPGHAFLNHTSLNSTRTGILIVPQGPLLVASTPILNSLQAGPAEGVLVMGRFLDASTLTRITKVTGAPLALRWNASQIKDAQQWVLFLASPSDTSSSGIFITPLSGDTVSAYTRILDLNDRPVLAVTILPRVHYREGVAIIINTLIILAAIFLATALVVMFIIDRVVLARLAVVIKKVGRMGKGQVSDLQPELDGNDEIARLEQEIILAYRDLHASEQNLRMFVNAISDPAMMMKPDGTINLANVALARVVGKPPEDLIGTPFRNNFPRTDYQIHADRFREGLKNKIFIPYEIEFREKTYLVTIYPSFEEGGKIGLVAVIAIDITERKKAENALSLAKKKLNLLNTVIFNDIQNKVFVQRGYLTLLKRMAKEPDTIPWVEKLERSEREIQESLNFAQHFQSMGMQPPKWQNVNDVMLFALSHVALESVAHDFRVEGLEIYADALLENVFSSLFENSLVHGNVKSVIRSWFQEDEHGLILYFEDDGDGVPPDRKELIFSKGSGTGGAVGLFLSREILSITGITIAETGEFKKGARFEIRVPKDMYRIRKNGNPQEM